MSEEQVRAKLQEASKQFAGSDFNACNETLGSIPNAAEDPKVGHNRALCTYLSQGGNAVEALRGMGYSRDLKVLEDGTPGSTAVCFDYEGQEVAILNQAVVLIHNGEGDKALPLLMSLAQNSANFKTAVKVRVAVLLQITASIAGKSQTAAASQAVSQLLTGCQADLHADPTLLRMMQLALADGSALENWFNGSSKTPEDRVVLHNNMGVDTAKRQKHNLASLHFVLALRNLATIKDPDPFLLESILYNSGLCTLTAGGHDSKVAVLDSFLACQRTMEGSPQLWLRVAQTCASWLADEQVVGTLEAYRKKQAELHEAIKASGAIGSNSMLLSVPDREEVVPTVGPKKPDEATYRWLEIGCVAVKNAIWLLQPTADNLGLLQNVWIQGAFFESLRRNLSVSLKYSNEVISAYQKQHASKQSLQAVPVAKRIDNEIMLSAIAYAMESLVLVNRPGAAVKMLQSVSLGDLLTSAENCPGGRKPAVDALFVNLCVVHLANGSYKQAQAIASSVLSRLVVPGQPLTASGKCAILLQVLLEIGQGNNDRANELLSKHPIQPPFFK